MATTRTLVDEAGHVAGVAAWAAVYAAQDALVHAARRKQLAGRRYAAACAAWVAAVEAYQRARQLLSADDEWWWGDTRVGVD